MGSFHRSTQLTILFLALALSLAALPAAAGDTILSSNSGEDSAVFFIKDEPSVVINGFDLTPLNIPLPVTIDAVSISVNTPVYGSVFDMLVYQDANGGSPVDAELVYRQSVSLEATGMQRIPLDTPTVITAPVLWVGFYLPVDFRFHADVSGSSVLTYWAWTPGGTFDVSSLGNAEVLGPGDGTEPVEISMDGIARITAELRPWEYDDMALTFPLDQQLPMAPPEDTSALEPYPGCPGLYVDRSDSWTGGHALFTLDCYTEDEFHAIAGFAQPREQDLEVLRSGALYKLSTSLPSELHVPGYPSQLPNRVTHCLRVPPEDLERAVLGEVRESPQWGERWFVLPTYRAGDRICADVSVVHYISYFMPLPDGLTHNANLVMGHPRVYPHPLICGSPAYIDLPITNTGQDWFQTPTGDTVIILQDIHVRTNEIGAGKTMRVENSELGPGARPVIRVGPFYVTRYVDELHRITIKIDAEDALAEADETDNSWMTEYVLQGYSGRGAQDNCGDPEWFELYERAILEFYWWQQRCDQRNQIQPESCTKTYRSANDGGTPDDDSGIRRLTVNFAAPDSPEEAADDALCDRTPMVCQKRDNSYRITHPDFLDIEA